VRIYLPLTFPFLVFEVDVTRCPFSRLMSIALEILWMPGTIAPQAQDAFLWLQPQEAPSRDDIEIHNNSLPADPLRLNDLSPAGIAIMPVKPAGDFRSFQRAPILGDDGIILADRRFACGSVERISVPALVMNNTGPNTRSVFILGICGSPGEFAVELERWRANLVDEQLPESEYWRGVLGKLMISLPDKSILRQARYSLHNSLFSRSITSGERTVFIHGRRDRGYADCAKIHQSYQLHFAALASGETNSVREELLAFAALQDANG